MMRGPWIYIFGLLLGIPVAIAFWYGSYRQLFAPNYAISWGGSSRLPPSARTGFDTFLITGIVTSLWIGGFARVVKMFSKQTRSKVDSSK